MNANKNDTKYIDGIKAFACFFIMWGHYYGLCAHTTTDTFDGIPLLDILAQIGKGVFVDAEFWSVCFCVISGYLLGSARIETVWDFLIKSFKRFLRFYLPIMAACCFIFCIYKIVGFHTLETVGIFENAQYQGAYNGFFTWRDIIIDSFQTVAVHNRGGRFNSPYWMVRHMFCASILIYFCNFLKYMHKRKGKLIVTILMLCVAKYFFHEIVLWCVCGTLVKWYEDAIRPRIGKVVSVLVLLLVCYLSIYKRGGENYAPHKYYFAALLLVLPNIQAVTRFLSAKVFLKISELSFGIYSFHWPVLCSVGGLIITHRWWRWDWLPLLAYVWSSCIAITFVMSWLYSMSLEKIATLLIDKTDYYLQRLKGEITCGR